MDLQNPEFIVQASSRSWSGGQDVCLNTVEQRPVVYWTLKRILDSFPGAHVVIAAPSFDEAGPLSRIAGQFGGRVKTFYGFDSSPLLRMLAAHDRYLTRKHFCRVDGLNTFFCVAPLKKMLAACMDRDLDCIKFPDAYPMQLTADVYNKEALRRLSLLLEADSPYHVHPKYALFDFPGFKAEHATESLEVSDDHLARVREMYRQVYLAPRDEMTDQSIPHGDTLEFHYRMAVPYLRKGDSVLDIACGGGKGAALLAGHARCVVGADLDPQAVEVACKRYGSLSNLEFQVQDVTRMSFENAHFDVVTSFETIEHVDPTQHLREIRRVLKPGGLLILSTPQNLLGHIPLNPQHCIEFSLPELEHLVSPHFQTVDIKAIKQGCILARGESLGANTFYVGRKSSRVADGCPQA